MIARPPKTVKSTSNFDAIVISLRRGLSDIVYTESVNQRIHKLMKSRWGDYLIHLRTILAAGVIAAPPAAALARPGTVYWTTYLRTGPGVQYAVIDEVEPESQVDVKNCDNGWCQVGYSSAVGYIKEALMSEPDIHARPPANLPAGSCFVAQLNGTPRGGEAVRFCGK